MRVLTFCLALLLSGCGVPVTQHEIERSTALCGDRGLKYIYWPWGESVKTTCADGAEYRGYPETP